MSRTYEALQKAEAGRGQTAPDAVVARPNGKNGKHGKRAAEFNPSHLDPMVEEQYQKLRSNLFGPADKETLRTVMVVAGAHGEGATTTSSILSTLLAKSGVGDVVLIDANLRTPALAELFDLPDTTRGLTDLITNGFPPRDLVQPTAVPHLFVVPAGRPLPSPSMVYQDPIQKLLADIRGDFRYVLVDCSPVIDYSDASFLAPRVDGIVMVLRAEVTRIEDAVKMKRQLEWAGGQVIGTVLNGKKNYIPMLLQRFL
jgi:capsular exopolysaccharide synthesis family protein